MTARGVCATGSGSYVSLLFFEHVSVLEIGRLFRLWASERFLGMEGVRVVLGVGNLVACIVMI